MIIRESDYPLNIIDEIYSNASIKNLMKYYKITNDKDIIDKIKLLSPSLKYGLEVCNIKDKVYDTVDKYLLRMSSNPINLSIMGNCSDKYIDENYIKIDLSDEWIDNFELMLFEKSKYNNDLKLYINTTLIEYEKFYIFYLNKYSKIKIYKNKIIGFIISEFLKEDSISYGELINFIKNNYKYDNEQTNYIICKLLKLNLISTKTYINKGIKRYSEIVKYISDDKYKKIFKYINEIYKIKCLDRKTIKKINDLLKYMESVILSKNYLYFEKYKKYNKCNEVKFEQNFLFFLRKLNYINNDYHKIDKIKLNLIEKYGKNFKIKFIDLFKDDAFKEYVLNYKNNIKNISAKKEIELYFINRILIAIFNKSFIDITDTDIEYINKYILKIDIKYDCDFDIKYQKLKGNKILFNGISVMFPSNSFSSKYSDINKNNLNYKEYLKIINLKANYLPDLSRNIYSENGLNIYKDKNFDFKNLMICVENEEIFIINSKTNKKIIPIYNTMVNLNYSTENQMIRLLCDIGKYILISPINMYLTIFDRLEYIPEIRYKNIVIMKSTWNYYTKEKLEFGEFKKDFNYFRKKFEIPDKFCIVTALSGVDYPILLNNLLGWKIIYEEYKKNQYIKITQYHYDDLEENIFKEYIQTISSKCRKYSDIIQNKQLELKKITFEKYDSFTILIDENTDKNDLILDIYKLCDLKNKDYFYIFYKDENFDSIRLRINKSNKGYKISKILDTLISLKKEMKIKKFYYSDLYNEILRYGGYKFEKNIFKFFNEDSNDAIDFIKSYDDIKKCINEIIGIYYSFYNDWDIILKSVDIVNLKEERKVFLKEFKKIYNIRQINIIFNSIKKYKEIQYIGENVECSKEMKKYIIESFVHMYINRRNLANIEKKLFFFISEIIKKIKYINLGDYDAEL